VLVYTMCRPPITLAPAGNRLEHRWRSKYQIEIERIVDGCDQG
jgi:hypothetical protein